MNSRTRRLVAEYHERKKEIKKRLGEFRRLRNASNEEIFQELCFCILTANANALHCDKAIKELKDRDLLINGTAGQIRPSLKGRVRFHNKKASFLVGARKPFSSKDGLDVKSRIDLNDLIKTRDWLVENIKGYGYKEASHFLRNIGLGSSIAILDRHILKNLKKYGVISGIPHSLGSRKTYMYIEEKMRKFSRLVGIPMDEMDLLFWSMETGFIFK